MRNRIPEPENYQPLRFLFNSCHVVKCICQNPRDTQKISISFLMSKSVVDLIRLGILSLACQSLNFGFLPISIRLCQARHVG